MPPILLPVRVVDDPLEYVLSQTYLIEKRALREAYPEINTEMMARLEQAIIEAESNQPHALEGLRILVLAFRLAAESARNAPSRDC